MIWFFERESELIVCEIRRAADNEETFEFEVADAEGPKTQCFDSAREGAARFSAHTGFDDPTSPPDAPPRESIEVRTLVFHHA